VPWWTWLCLGIFLLSLVAAAVFAVFAWGRIKRVRPGLQAIEARLDEVSVLAEEVQRKQERNQAHMEELQRRRARAEASIARLQVLTSALSEATGHPRKAKKRFLSK
jgi:hypothetical protein